MKLAAAQRQLGAFNLSDEKDGQDGSARSFHQPYLRCCRRTTSRSDNP